VRAESVDFDTTRNLFIEGDNLEALKLLQETYLGKVKMIYIDPPYNTGRDLIYDDDFSEKSDEYFVRANLIDESGNRLVPNPASRGRFHSVWLDNAYPRIKLSRNLLTDDGFMAISIDDNEVANMLSVVDEVFGWENRKLICVKMSESSGLKMGSVKKYGTIPKLKEYVILCSKSGISGFRFDGIKKDKWDAEYNIFLKGMDRQDRDFIGQVVDGGATEKDIEKLDEIASRIELISLADTLKQEGVPAERKEDWCFENAWRICQCATSASVLKLAKKKRETNKNKVFFVQTDSGLVYPVRSDFSESSSKPRVQLIFADDNAMVHPGDIWVDIKTTGLDGEGGVSFKNGKKPLKLLRRLLESKTNQDDLVLDFFAGSGSFGHAVMASNSDLGVNRKFILVQWPEELKGNDEDQKESYAFCVENDLEANVAELSKERLRRSGAKILEGECHPDWNRDVGFRVLKIDSSNMADVYYTPDATTQADLLTRVDNIKPDRSPEDLLFQVLLDWGVDLTLPITRESVDGKTVFTVAGTALIACFDNGVDETLGHLEKLP
jgi:adenine-specific DNA-methyltransferase